MDRVNPRNVAGALAVLLLHALFVALLLRTSFGRLPFTPPQEQTIWLRLPAASPAQSHRVPKGGEAHKRHISIFRSPARAFSTRAIALPALPNASAMKGLHGSLFGCAPETLANLTEAQRANCRGTLRSLAPYDPNAVDFADHSGKVPGAQRWAREVARKNAPLLLPCASPAGIGVSIWTAICVGKGVLNGFDLEHKAEYFDHVEEAHVPNNGDAKTLDVIH